MFIKDDNTYNEIREKSLNQWLDEMESMRISQCAEA